MEQYEYLIDECKTFLTESRFSRARFCAILGLNHDLTNRWLSGKSSLKKSDLIRIENYLYSAEAQELLQRGRSLKTVTEAAALTGMRPARIRKLCQKGKINSEWDNFKYLVDISGLYEYIAKIGFVPEMQCKNVVDEKAFGNLHMGTKSGEYWIPVAGNNPEDIFGDPENHTFDLQYWVSSQGRVFNAATRNLISEEFDTKKYVMVSLKKKGKYVSRAVHELVAYHFCPNRQNKQHVHHINGNKQDNRACNLIWVTASQHRFCHDLKNKGDEEQYYQYINQIKLENEWE